jgi:UDP-N-acetylmuramate dehydrogenase
MEQLYTTLKTYGKVRLNEPLGKHATCKIGGPANYFVTVSTTPLLIELLSFLDSEGVPYTILGGGSNVLPSDDLFEGVVIHVATQGFRIEGTTIIADAGVLTAKAAHESVKAGLTGFEWGVGVPGTLGGAVRGNAGAMGKEMKDDVLKIVVYQDGEVVEMMNDACGFGYRTSMLKETKAVVLEVWLHTEKATSAEGMKKALEVLAYRQKTQPKGVASSGCVFKNVAIGDHDIPQEDAKKHRAALLTHFDKDNEKVQSFLRLGKISAGWLIEQAGLKALRMGTVEVSPVHGNFIVSSGGNARASDVRALVTHIKDAVFAQYGIALEEEIVMW